MFGALKRWKEAEEFFEIVVTSPAQTPAAIQLEALKKLTLVQLILYGKVCGGKVNTKLRLTRNRGHAGDPTTKVHQRDAHTSHQVYTVQQFCACIPSQRSFAQQSHLQRRRCVQNGECLAVHYYSGALTESVAGPKLRVGAAGDRPCAAVVDQETDVDVPHPRPRRHRQTSRARSRSRSFCCSQHGTHDSTCHT